MDKKSLEHSAYVSVVAAVTSSYLVDDSQINLFGMNLPRAVGVGLIAGAGSYVGQMVNEKVQEKYPNLKSNEQQNPVVGYAIDGAFTGGAMVALLGVAFGSDVLTANNVLRAGGYGMVVEGATSYAHDTLVAKGYGNDLPF